VPDNAFDHDLRKKVGKVAEARDGNARLQWLMGHQNARRPPWVAREGRFQPLICRKSLILLVPSNPRPTD
jgi:hypothetical protein